MLLRALLCLCAAAVSSVCAFRAEVRDPKSVKVSVYYESMDSGCRDFFNKQLWPHWNELEEGINLDLVPFGRSNASVVEEQWVFACEHGPEECVTNKLHACVIKRLHSHKSKMLKVLKCLINKKDQQVEGLPDCLAEIHIKPDTDKFMECVNSPEGDSLLAAYGLRTQKAFKSLDSMPKIIYNDKYKKRDEAEAKKDFRKLICDHYLIAYCEAKNIRKEIKLQL